MAETVWRAASRGTQVNAKCDKQVTFVIWLLTTLDDCKHAAVK